MKDLFRSMSSLALGIALFLCMSITPAYSAPPGDAYQPAFEQMAWDQPCLNSVVVNNIDNSMSSETFGLSYAVHYSDGFGAGSTLDTSTKHGQENLGVFGNSAVMKVP